MPLGFYGSFMSFRLKASHSGLGKRKDGLSVAAAPYHVKLKNGKDRFCAHLKEVYGEFSQAAVDSVFDRHEKAFLDLEALWSKHRRRFLSLV